MRVCAVITLRRLARGAALVACIAAACSRQPASPLAPATPQVAGTLALDGLLAAVRIVRDVSGIPHIYADNRDDLFFAQGFVQAQDRLFQMDLWRRSVQGRLSEVLGSNFAERDAMTRRMQYRGDVQAEWSSYGPDTAAIATAFVRGVNAWVDIALEHPAEEFALAGWRPDHWQPQDILNRTDAFLASADSAGEVFRARLIAAIGVERANAILSPLPRVHVPRGLDPATISYILGDALRRVGSVPFFSGLAAPVGVQGATIASETAARQTFGATAPPIRRDGSRAWAIGGSRFATGLPVLAVDPIAALANPSLRYLVHLKAPGWNVIGAASPWLPGVIIGHTDGVAWGMTQLDADVQDLYVERVNPDNPHQVEDGGKWIDTDIVPDSIVVKGRDKSFPFEREYTRHGVIVAVDPERHLAFTVQWTGFDAGTAGELGALALDRAQTEVDIVGALARWKLPAATFVYIDVDGRWGTQPAAVVPVRHAADGTLPVVGWSQDFDWHGDRPLSRLGSTEKAQSKDGRRLQGGTRTRQAVLDLDDIKRMQNEPLALYADRLVPLLARLHADRVDVEEARQNLLRWDHRLTIDSTTASRYVAWERLLIRKMTESKVPAGLVDEFVVRLRPVLVAALENPTVTWFGNRPDRARDTLLLEVLQSILDGERRPQSAGLLPWGRLHAALFEHPLGITTAARERFNVGPFESAGQPEMTMSNWRSRVEQNTGTPFKAIFLAGDWDRSVVTNAPGQSGSPASPHFADLAKSWAAGEYVPLPFSDAAVQASTETTLMLVPRRSR
jgi:penicillin amidase